jgi:IS30 family transposase
VSHETIYRTLFVQTRGALNNELLKHLRDKPKTRLSRHGSPMFRLRFLQLRTPAHRCHVAH